MQVTMLSGKIHRATVTQAELGYIGSITIDEDLMDAARILEYQRVEIADVDNGARFATYAIAGERGSGIVCLNGAAARCACTGDKVIVMAYAEMDEATARTHRPSVVFVDDANRIARVAAYERHGRLEDLD
jgi:aspartate 1-decarboxylase